MSARNLLSLALLALLAACASQTPTQASLPAGTLFGESMEPQGVVRFSVVDASPSAYFDRTVLVEATAVAVCQKAGCWMQIEDEGKTALVRWETGCGGKYEFPRHIAGQRIVIQGSFYPKTLSPDDIEHMREEAGSDVDLPEEGYEFNASAVLVLT